MTAWIILLSALSATSLVIAFNWIIWVVLGVIVVVLGLKVFVVILALYKKNKNINLDNKLKKEQLKKMEDKNEQEIQQNKELL